MQAFKPVLNLICKKVGVSWAIALFRLTSEFEQFSVFKWLQKRVKCDPNGGKKPIFFEKSQKLPGGDRDTYYGGVKKIFFGNSKKCSLEILANGLKIEKNRLEPVATYHGLATPPKIGRGG